MVVRVLVQTNAFLKLEPIAGNCDIVTDVRGPEDLEVGPESGLIYVSAFDIRPAMTGGEASAGTLYLFDPDDPEGTLQVATGTAPDGFHPHGMSLYDGGRTGKRIEVVNYSPPERPSSFRRAGEREAEPHGDPFWAKGSSRRTT